METLSLTRNGQTFKAKFRRTGYWLHKPDGPVPIAAPHGNWQAQTPADVLQTLSPLGYKKTTPR